MKDKDRARSSKGLVDDWIGHVPDEKFWSLGCNKMCGQFHKWSLSITSILSSSSFENLAGAQCARNWPLCLMSWRQERAVKVGSGKSEPTWCSALPHNRAEPKPTAKIVLGIRGNGELYGSIRGMVRHTLVLTTFLPWRLRPRRAMPKLAASQQQLELVWVMPIQRVQTK